MSKLPNDLKVRVRFIKYNFYHAIDIWINQLEQNNIVLIKNLTVTLPKTNPYGDCIFVFDIKEPNEIPNPNLL